MFRFNAHFVATATLCYVVIARCPIVHSYFTLLVSFDLKPYKKTLKSYAVTEVR